MTEKERLVELCKIDVALQALKVREAEEAFDREGYRLKIDREERMAKVTNELERNQLLLKKDEAWLKSAIYSLENFTEPS